MQGKHVENMHNFLEKVVIELLLKK